MRRCKIAKIRIDDYDRKTSHYFPVSVEVNEMLMDYLDERITEPKVELTTEQFISLVRGEEN